MLVERLAGLVVFFGLLSVLGVVVWTVCRAVAAVRVLVPLALVMVMAGCDPDLSALRGSFDAAAVDPVDALRVVPRFVAPDAGAAIDGGVPICGSGAIVIAEDCGQVVSGWHCEVPTDLDRAPCVVPNLSRVLVASCDLCQAVRL